MKYFIKFILLICILCITNEVLADDRICDMSNGGIAESNFGIKPKCRATGAISQIVTFYEVGVCSAYPTIGSEGGANSDFKTNCQAIYQSSGLSIDIFNNPTFPNVNIPQTGNYPYSYFIVSNQISLTASVPFDSTLTVNANNGKTNGNATCYTNGKTVMYAGRDAIPLNENGSPIISSSIAADCGLVSNPIPNLLKFYFLANNGSDSASIYGKSVAPYGTMDVHIVNSNLQTPPSFIQNVATPNDASKIIVINTLTTPLDIKNNVVSGAQICTTSELNIIAQTTNGLFVDAFSGSEVHLQAIRLAPFFFGFQSQGLSCTTTATN